MPLPPALTAAIAEAVRALECCSCAEVVVEVRARSGSYAHADARFGALLAFAALLVLLFSPWPFAPAWVAVDVVLAYAFGVWIARRTVILRRLMTARRERAEQVRRTAGAVFYERGVANTAGETGVLVYVSQLERRIEILADRGVLLAVPPLVWNQLLERVRGRVATAETLVEVLRELTPLLEEHLPLREGDRDELANAPRFVSE